MNIGHSDPLKATNANSAVCHRKEFHKDGSVTMQMSPPDLHLESSHSFDFFLKPGLNVVTTGSYPTASLKKGINLFLLFLR